MDNKGYYKILGLNAGASAADVKRAYSKSILEFHPDMGKTTKKVKSMPEGPEKDRKMKEVEEKIRKLNEAKTVLSDPEKKKLYDQGIDENAQQGFDMGGFDIFDFMGGMGGRRPKGQKKVKDTEFEVKLTLKDAYLGRKKTFNVKREIICTTCDGKGGANSYVCTYCNGEGEVAVKRQMGFMVSIDHQKCTNCNGEGNVIEGSACQGCKGKRYIFRTESVSVEFPKGFSHGEVIKVKGKGDEHVGAIPGDLILIATVQEDSHFRRINNHIVVQAEIELYTALVGGLITLRHVDGSVMSVQIDKLKNLREDVIVVKGAGFPGGDLYIEPFYITKQVDLNEITKTISKPNTVSSGMKFKGSLGKLPQQKTKKQYNTGSSGFKESVFSQFLSGF